MPCCGFQALGCTVSDVVFDAVTYAAKCVHVLRRVGLVVRAREHKSEIEQAGFDFGFEKIRLRFSSKIHLLVDALGIPLKFILTRGERHDISQAESLLPPFHFDAVIADKGYDSDPLRELLAAQQVEVVIPSRRYRKQPRDYDRIRYRERNIVERFINKIKWYRRIFTRYEKLARRYMAFLHLAATLIWLE